MHRRWLTRVDHLTTRSLTRMNSYPVVTQRVDLTDDSGSGSLSGETRDQHGETSHSIFFTFSFFIHVQYPRMLNPAH